MWHVCGMMWQNKQGMWQEDKKKSCGPQHVKGPQDSWMICYMYCITKLVSCPHSFIISPNKRTPVFFAYFGYSSAVA